MIFLIKNLHSSRMFAFKPSFMDDFHFPNLPAFLQMFPHRSKPRSVYPRYRRPWRSRWNRPEAHLAALGMAHMSDRARRYRRHQKTVMLMAGTIIIVVMMNTTIYWYWVALLLLASLLWSRWWWRWWWWWWCWCWCWWWWWWSLLHLYGYWYWSSCWWSRCQSSTSRTAHEKSGDDGWNILDSTWFDCRWNKCSWTASGLQHTASWSRRIIDCWHWT